MSGQTVYVVRRVSDGEGVDRECERAYQSVEAAKRWVETQDPKVREWHPCGQYWASVAIRDDRSCLYYYEIVALKVRGS